jgi:hypothetical protein
MMLGRRSGNASFAGFMPDLLALPFVICAVVACIAGMVRGFAGFGAAMLMTPVFSALHGPVVGVALCLLLEIAVALPLVPGVVRLVDWRRIGLLLLAAAAGVPLGNLVLIRASPSSCAGRSRSSFWAVACWQAALRWSSAIGRPP